MFPLCGLRAAAGSIKLHKRETMKSIIIQTILAVYIANIAFDLGKKAGIDQTIEAFKKAMSEVQVAGGCDGN
jgi:hypothetical protein